jgi:hypothetical protein
MHVFSYQYAQVRNKRRYYQDIGASSYVVAGELLPGDLFEQLSTHFIFLSDFIELTIHSSKNDIHEMFR